MPLCECQRVHLVWQRSLSFSMSGASVLSVLDSTTLGSTVSMLFFARLGNSFLATGAGSLSADLSIHAFSFVEVPFSAEGRADVLGRLFVSSNDQFGSDFSAALAARLGNAVSVFTECSFGSSLSFNAFSRLGSAVSVVGLD